jgi:hypothetical protein
MWVVGREVMTQVDGPTAVRAVPGEPCPKFRGSCGARFGREIRESPGTCRARWGQKGSGLLVKGPPGQKSQRQKTFVVSATPSGRARSANLSRAVAPVASSVPSQMGGVDAQKRKWRASARLKRHSSTAIDLVHGGTWHIVRTIHDLAMGLGLRLASCDKLHPSR